MMVFMLILKLTVFLNVMADRIDMPLSGLCRLVPENEIIGNKI